MEPIDKELEFHRAYDRISDAYVALDTRWCYTHVNAKAGEMFGRTPAELIGRHIWTEFPEGVGRPFHLAYEKAMAEQQPITLEEYYPPFGRWFENRIYPSPDGLTIYFLDVTDRKHNALIDAGQRDILSGIAAQRPLVESLGDIARLHESLCPGALCSVLLLDAERRHVLHGAAPSLPEAYNQALHGLEVGDSHGSCGTAVWRRERVVVTDIATHPFWANYRDLALAHGLRACWSTPVFGSSGQVLGTFAVYRRAVCEPDARELETIDKLLSITAIAIENAQLIHRLRERDAFFNLSMDIYCVFDTRSQRIVQINPAFSAVTGHDAQGVTSRHYLEFVHPDDVQIATTAVATLNAVGTTVHQVTYRFLCKDGNYRWLAWESVVGPDGLAYAVAHDVTERRRVDAELAHAASHDAVTGLPRRLVLEAALSSLLQSPARPVWVLLVGVDRFHAVNESMGHLVGDDVLRRVAIRLRDALRGAGNLAQFAGDEFVVAIADTDQASVLVLAERLREAVGLPIRSGDYLLLLTASIGISHSPDHGRCAQELLHRAEAAMTRAKRQGRDRVWEFSVQDMQDIEARLLLGAQLRRAVAGGELELHYQPLQHAADGTLSGFEALLRWNSPVLGRVPPASFIPVAEALGLMSEIGAWVVDEACRQGRAWLDRGHRDFSIAVNISAQELQRPGLVTRVGDALCRHALPPEVLNIEMTESSLMENVERVRGTLTELTALGVRLSLDDFGTGYSSLAYLKHFPIDKLKIDQSFVYDLPGNADDAAIARTIVAMAHQLRMVVAAEGVETQAQALFLSGIGCDELQGYHFGRPMPAGDAEALLARVGGAGTGVPGGHGA